MNYKYIWTIMACCAILTVQSCKKEEVALTPSGIIDGYVLPQGNNAFDNTIVDYYNKYNTYVLYKFDREDIYWTPTGYTIPTATASGYWSAGHEVALAEEAYIPAQLELVKTSLFDLYPEKFLKKFLPAKILLCSKVDSIAGGFSPTFQPVKITRSVAAYSYYNSICVNYGNATINTMTAADKKAFLKKLNTMFVDNIISRNLTAPTTDFINSADYATAMTTWTQALGKGIIIYYYSPTPQADWNAYIKAMVTLSEKQLNLATDITSSSFYATQPSLGILNARKDFNGQIKKRYALVRNYFINEYGIDLQTIGNAGNP